MGVLFWFVKAFAKILKPFVKIAFIESLIEVLMGVTDEEEESVSPSDA